MARPNIKHTSHPSNNLHIHSEIRQWGNSLGIRIPKDIRNGMHFSDGSQVLISMNPRTKKVIIENVSEEKKSLQEMGNGLDLKSLTRRISKKNHPTKNELFSGAIGKEVW